MTVKPPQKQINIRVGSALYRALESIAQEERRSVSQAALLLLEEGMHLRRSGKRSRDEISSSEIGAVAMAGGAFDWLKEDPDLYDDTFGEPI